MIDPAALPKLGKLPHAHDPRTLMLARYVDLSALPQVPTIYNAAAGVAAWPMFANDRLGDCTCAGVGHAIQSMTHEASAEVDLTDPVIVGFYTLVSGYNPSTGANDNGAVELDVLNAWRTVGVGGHLLGAFNSVDPNDPMMNKVGLYLFGGLYLGVQLPAYLQSIVANGIKIWDVYKGGSGSAQPGSWGGHCVWAVAYDADGVTIVTWGGLVKVTWAFFAAYVDESWVLLSPDWIESSGNSPTGYNLPALRGDLRAVAA